MACAVRPMTRAVRATSPRRSRSVRTARATAPLTKRTSAVSPSGTRRTATVELERQVNQLLDVFGCAMPCAPPPSARRRSARLGHDPGGIAAQRGEIQQAARHRVPVVDMRRGQHDAAAGCRVRLTVLCPAPLAPATTAAGRLVFGIFAALAEFEPELIRERTVAGLKATRARGRKGGRKFALGEPRCGWLRPRWPTATRRWLN